MKRLAIIPARGGSKRLPNKNVRDFLGKPIISYTIRAAIESDIFDRIIVSTDSEKIAEVSESFGAIVDKRPDRLSTGSAHLLDVCEDLLTRESGDGRDYEVLCMLHATSPLRWAADIKTVMDMIDTGDCEFAVALTEYNLPAHQALILDDDGYIKPFLPDLVSVQSHDIPPLVVGNGSTYAAITNELLKQKSFFGTRMRGYIMPRMRSVDIDYEEEFEIAEVFAKHLTSD